MKNILAKLLFHLVWAVFWLLGQVPLTILYWIADGLYLFNRYLVGYRRSVITQNITRSFPDFKYQQVDAVADRFNRFFFGTFIEIVKYIGANESYMKKHVLVQNHQVLIPYIKEKKNIFLVMGHYGNWESVNITLRELSVPAQFYAIYSKLNNSVMDQIFYKLRSKFGCQLIEMRKAGSTILRNKNEGGLYLFIADQAPSGNNGRYVEFLNQPTRMLEGVEKLARACDGVVFYTEINSVKRGYYHIRLTEMDPSKNYTDSFARELEMSIEKQPQYWLWSHRRWKRDASPIAQD